jgi:hypothetical protein
LTLRFLLEPGALAETWPALVFAVVVAANIAFLDAHGQG